jgi:hypothetical protein
MENTIAQKEYNFSELDQDHKGIALHDVISRAVVHDFSWICKHKPELARKISDLNNSRHHPMSFTANVYDFDYSFWEDYAGQYDFTEMGHIIKHK